MAGQNIELREIPGFLISPRSTLGRNRRAIGFTQSRVSQTLRASASLRSARGRPAAASRDPGR